MSATNPASSTSGQTGEPMNLTPGLVPDPSDTLRHKVVQILSTTANGCLEELHYYPGMLDRMAKLEEIANSAAIWQEENVKLFQDNYNLNLESHTLKLENLNLKARERIFSQPDINKVDMIQALYSHVHGVQAKIADLEQRNATLAGLASEKAPIATQLLHDHQILLQKYNAVQNEKAQLCQVLERMGVNSAGQVPSQRPVQPVSQAGHSSGSNPPSQPGPRQDRQQQQQQRATSDPTTSQPLNRGPQQQAAALQSVLSRPLQSGQHNYVSHPPQQVQNPYPQIQVQPQHARPQAQSQTPHPQAQAQPQLSPVHPSNIHPPQQMNQSQHPPSQIQHPYRPRPSSDQSNLHSVVPQSWPPNHTPPPASTQLGQVQQQQFHIDTRGSFVAHAANVRPLQQQQLPPTPPMSAQSANHPQMGPQQSVHVRPAQQSPHQHAPFRSVSLDQRTHSRPQSASSSYSNQSSHRAAQYLPFAPRQPSQSQVLTQIPPAPPSRAQPEQIRPQSASEAEAQNRHVFVHNTQSQSPLGQRPRLGTFVLSEPLPPTMPLTPPQSIKSMTPEEPSRGLPNVSPMRIPRLADLQVAGPASPSVLAGVEPLKRSSSVMLVEAGSPAVDDSRKKPRLEEMNDSMQAMELQNGSGSAEPSAVAVAVAADEDDDDDDESSELDDDGLVPIADCVASIMDEDSDNTCQLCLARFNRDPTSEPPTPFGNVSFETLEAHCVEKHLEGFEMLRKGAGFGKRPST